MKYNLRIEARREVASLERDGYIVVDCSRSRIEEVWKMIHANGNRILVEFHTIPFEYYVIAKNGKLVKFIS